MTIDTIRNKILEETGVDCYSKSRVHPIPDVKKIFYRAIVDFADNHESILKTSIYLNIDRSTFLHHLKIPLKTFLNSSIKVRKAYYLFYPTHEESFECKINQLKQENKKLKEKIQELESRHPKTITEYISI